ncbi:MAG: hypothetical protein ABIX46_12740 [Burkholderiaceae bacterium]
MNHEVPALFASRNDFIAAVRAALADVAQHGGRELWMLDLDFADWPLNEPAVIEHLRLWARPHRKLTLIAHDFDTVARRHPRWVDFRRTWAHVVECRTNTEVEAGRMPSLLLAPGRLVLRRFDPLRYRGSVSHDAASQLQTREVVEAVLQRSTLAFPPSVLGV